MTALRFSAVNSLSRSSIVTACLFSIPKPPLYFGGDNLRKAYKLLALILVVVFFALQISAASGDTTVYVTNTGEKYHTYGCQYLRKSRNPISLENAVYYGYTRCSKCSPPYLDSTPEPTPAQPSVSSPPPSSGSGNSSYSSSEGHTAYVKKDDHSPLEEYLEESEKEKQRIIEEIEKQSSNSLKPSSTQKSNTSKQSTTSQVKAGDQSTKSSNKKTLKDVVSFIACTCLITWISFVAWLYVFGFIESIIEAVTKKEISGSTGLFKLQITLSVATGIIIAVCVFAQ